MFLPGDLAEAAQELRKRAEWAEQLELPEQAEELRHQAEDPDELARIVAEQEAHEQRTQAQTDARLDECLGEAAQAEGKARTASTAEVREFYRDRAAERRMKARCHVQHAEHHAIRARRLAIRSAAARGIFPRPGGEPDPLSSHRVAVHRLADELPPQRAGMLRRVMRRAELVDDPYAPDRFKIAKGSEEHRRLKALMATARTPEERDLLENAFEIEHAPADYFYAFDESIPTRQADRVVGRVGSLHRHARERRPGTSRRFRGSRRRAESRSSAGGGDPGGDDPPDDSDHLAARSRGGWLRVARSSS